MKKDIWKVFSTNLIKMATTFVSTLLIPMFFSIDEYSYYKVYSLYAAYIGIFHFGYCDGVFIEYGGKSLEEVNKEESAIGYKTILCFSTLISVAVLGSGILCQNFIAIMLGLNIMPTIMIHFLTTVYQAVGKMDYYARVYRNNAILGLIAGIVCIVFNDLCNAKTLIVTQTLVNYYVAISAILGYCKIKGIGRKGKPQFCVLKRFIKSGILLMLGNMSYILFNSIDKWTIRFVMTDFDFAKYSFAIQLLSILNMFANPIGLTFFSYMAKRKDKQYEFKLKRTILAILSFMLAGVFVIKIIIKLFIAKYIEAIPTICILFLSQLFLLLNTIIYVNLFKTYKLQRVYIKNLMYTIICSVILNIGYICMFGINIENVALATLTSMVIWSLLNLKSINYLRLSMKDYSFLIICIIAYLMCISYDVELVGMCIYIGIWAVSLLVLMRDIFMFGVVQVKKMLALRD